jgi:glycosyltransferase involved in cell wall biosynthesis
MLPDGVAEEYYLKFIDIKTNSSIVSENVILFVGSVEYRKGIDTLLKAFGIVKNEFPDWVVKIVGPINSSEYKRFLDKLVKSQGLKDKVIFVGYLDGKDLVREFLNSSIFVLPSRHESFGIVLVEAAFFGKPIISSNVGAAEYLLDHGKAGLLFEPNDLQSLANLLKTMMLSKELRDKFGKEVKSRYLRLFSWKKNILRLSIIINYLASNKR